MIQPNLNVLDFVKGGERYVFLYDDNVESRHECLRILGRFASNPELSFSWYDAAVLSQKVRQESKSGGRSTRNRIIIHPSNEDF